MSITDSLALCKNCYVVRSLAEVARAKLTPSLGFSYLILFHSPRRALSLNPASASLPLQQPPTGAGNVEHMALVCWEPPASQMLSRLRFTCSACFACALHHRKAWQNLILQLLGHLWGLLLLMHVKPNLLSCFSNTYKCLLPLNLPQLK